LTAACGDVYSPAHADCTWNTCLLQSFFEELRVNPYFRHLMSVHPDRKVALQNVIDQIMNHPLALVHGDFSPKNMLVSEGDFMLVDYEVGHFGDPAFDVGFFLSHIVLKSLRTGRREDRYLNAAQLFWDTYYRNMSANSIPEIELKQLESRCARVFAGCMLARVDGKSPVDYLQQPDVVRQLARRILANAPFGLNDLESALRQ